MNQDKGFAETGALSAFSLPLLPATKGKIRALGLLSASLLGKPNQRGHSNPHPRGKAAHLCYLSSTLILYYSPCPQASSAHGQPPSSEVWWLRPPGPTCGSRFSSTKGPGCTHWVLALLDLVGAPCPGPMPWKGPAVCRQ